MSESSKEFYSAFCHSGSLVIDCQYCGRTYFGNGGDFEEGELEGLEEKAKLNPDKYIQVSDDSTSWFVFNGKQCVFDCRCGADRRIEDLIWGHRFDIVQYITARAKLEKSAAIQDEAELTTADKALNEPPTPRSTPL